jgi:hypothetical protein
MPALNSNNILLSSALFICSMGSLQAQQRKTVEFTGGARSGMTNSRLFTQDSIPDTATVRRQTGGYALIDLGVNIRPNANTEILGMFRIRNQYGGFWGAGVSFDVRQLWLKGVVADVLRYQVGDLNLKQTPFTLYNPHADRLDSLPEIFRLQQQIVDYERFYMRNTWRQQGIHLATGFQFDRYIKDADVQAYITRLQATDFATRPERLMGGYTLRIRQSDNFSLAWNAFSVFDVKGTALDTATFNNTVQTLQLGLRLKKNISVQAEAGTGRYAHNGGTQNFSLNDYFIHARGLWISANRKLQVHAAYLNVGPDFRSVGAQSKDVRYNAAPAYFNTYANGRFDRPIGLYDQIGNENLYNVSVTTALQPVNPVYNFVLPFGLATFNRVGAYGGISLRLPAGMSANITHHRLSEIRGQGTLLRTGFARTQAYWLADIGEAAKWKKSLRIRAGIDHQSAQRNSETEFEKIAFSTTRYSAGTEIEIFRQIDLMAGLAGIRSNGNLLIPERDAFTRVNFISPLNMDQLQFIQAAGIRCRFGSGTWLTLMAQASRYEDAKQAAPPYRLNQINIIYNMTF